MRPALLLGVLALVLAACGGDARPAAPSTPGSTLRATLVDADGDGFLERGPGEPLVDRGTAAEPGRTLATFAQLTDTHVRDEESPARVPFLDRTGGPFTSTFRPQEAFSTQTLDAAVRAVNREKPQAVFVTGDITDNAQRNELTMALDTLNGKTVDPDSGAKGYDGVQDADSADPFYYRPDHDAPTHAGAIEQAQKPFKAAGLKAPWYPLVGNHDVLAQGEVPPTPAIDAFATGDRLVPSLDPNLRPPTREVDAKQAVEAVLSGQVPLDTVHTPADQDRVMNAPGEAERRLGHPDMDYTVDLGAKVEAILIDTVNRDGSSQARINPQQLEWLRQTLDATDRWVVVFSHNPLTDEALAHPRPAPEGRRQHRRQQAQEPDHAPGHDRYWQISTSSLADFPQQARMFRLRETGKGVALETWMVDHDGGGLAGVSRELAYLDAQGGRLRTLRENPLTGTQDCSCQIRNRNTRLSLPFLNASSHSRGEVREDQGFPGQHCCPGPRRRMRSHGRRSGPGEPVGLAVGQSHTAGEHDPRDGLHRRPRLRHRRRRHRPAHRRRRRDVGRSGHRHLAGSDAPAGGHARRHHDPRRRRVRRAPLRRRRGDVPQDVRAGRDQLPGPGRGVVLRHPAGRLSAAA